MKLLPKTATVGTAAIGGLYSGALGLLTTQILHDGHVAELVANLVWLLYVVFGFALPVAYGAVGRQYLRSMVGKRNNKPASEVFAEAALRMLVCFVCASLFPIGAGLLLLLRS
jgi:hypothetical protein